MHSFFIIIVGLYILGGAVEAVASKDSTYLYQDKDIDINIVSVANEASVKVIRNKDKKVLIESKGEPFYIDKSSGVLDISYRILKRLGGFDIIYNIKNRTNRATLMPDFQIPGIKFTASKTLDILNTNTKQYMEGRYISELKRLNQGYIAVSPFRQVDHRGNIQEEEMRYASGTLSPYSPVIAVKDEEFSIGTSLNYPILQYEDKSPRSKGNHNVISNKLYPKMRLYKDSDSWRFEYSFAKEGSFVGRIDANKEYKFTIPVRFSKPEFWLLTLHPYKDYFLKLYEIKNPTPKDVSPMFLTSLSFYGNSVTAKSKRGWAWALENVDKNGYSYMPIKQVTTGLSRAMKINGYKRMIFCTFSGVYNAYKYPSLYNELPFQFITNLEPNMEKELDESLKVFKNAGQEFGFWWGIAGMMPVDKKGEVIGFNTWQPHTDIPYLYDNPTHRRYALRQLYAAKDVKTDFLTLDAYVRMEENDRISWLDEMKQRAPEIKFYLEQQVDFMHAKASILLQPENPVFGVDKSDFSKSRLTEPAIFSHYLNPKSEVQVWILYNTSKDNTAYVKNLVKWGYTPILTMPNVKHFDHDERNVTKRILDNANFFIPVNNLDNSKIAACFDGLDNDKDGKIDWPYDEGCLNSSDGSE